MSCNRPHPCSMVLGPHIVDIRIKLTDGSMQKVCRHVSNMLPGGDREGQRGAHRAEVRPPQGNPEGPLREGREREGRRSGQVLCVWVRLTNNPYHVRHGGEGVCSLAMASIKRLHIRCATRHIVCLVRCRPHKSTNGTGRRSRSVL